MLDDGDNSTSNRTIRQESNEVDIDVNNNGTNNKQKESQESEEEEEEEPDMITGLISAFLGGLSRVSLQNWFSIKYMRFL